MENAEEVMELGPTEETIEALLDYLVEPFLSLINFKARETPSISQHQLVAKQVHAVVLLYNYYHRKYNPALETLTFESFCKLAIVLKPNLMAYLSLMHQSNYYLIDDLENYLSQTEKAIMNAIDISSALDASKQVPHSDNWPISKIAILLIDSKMENCLISLSTVTDGVWSVIEKDVKEKRTLNRMSFNKKLSIANQDAYKLELLKLAFLTIEEVEGINQTDLAVIESRDVYSLTKEKSATRFYIMRCVQSSNKDFHMPIKHVIESLKGPLVKEKSCGWVVNPAVKYFHMLPYMETIQDCLSREILPHGLLDLESEDLRKQNSPLTNKSNETLVCNEKSMFKESCITTDLVVGETSTQINESLEKKETNECALMCLSNKVDEVSDMDVDDLTVFHSKKKDLESVVEVHDQAQNMSISEANKHALVINTMPEAEMVEPISRLYTSGLVEETNDSRISLFDQDVITNGNNEAISLRSNGQNLDKVEDQAILTTKEDASTQTALNILLRKREDLSHQLRSLADEMALCDNSIQTILKGGENGLNLAKAIMIQERENNVLPVHRRKKLSEAILSVRKPCQELDDICHMNNWKLPTYHQISLNDGFQYSVTLEGCDFKLTLKGNIHTTYPDARDSAATHMISKLHKLVAQSN